MYLRIEAGEEKSSRLQVDSMAIRTLRSDYTSIRYLMAASLTGSWGEIAAAKAMIQSRGGFSAYLSTDHRNLNMHSPGYHVAVHRFPEYNTGHLVMRSKSAKVVVGSVQEAVGGYLMSKETTTPILRSWLPWVVDQLVSGGFVTQMECEGEIDAHHIGFTDKHCDAIVGDGVRNGFLSLTA